MFPLNNFTVVLIFKDACYLLYFELEVLVFIFLPSICSGGNTLNWKKIIVFIFVIDPEELVELVLYIYTF